MYRAVNPGLNSNVANHEPRPVEQIHTRDHRDTRATSHNDPKQKPAAEDHMRESTTDRRADELFAAAKARLSNERHEELLDILCDER